MLQEILEDGHFYYECQQEECGLQLRAHIADSAVEHQKAQVRTDTKGSVVALPPCPECNSRCFLKADYVVKDFTKKMLCPVVDEKGTLTGYVMKRTHSLNFRLLNMLYEIGKFPEPPLLPVLAFEAIRQSALYGVPVMAIDAIFLVYALTGQCLNLSGVDTHIMALAGPITPLLQSTRHKQISQKGTL